MQQKCNDSKHTQRTHAYALGLKLQSGTEQWNIHALHRSRNLTALETISLNQCSEWWLCWALCSSVQHDRSSLQRSRL